MLGKYDLMAFAPTAEPARAREFYEGTLGLSVLGSDDYGVTYDVNGRRLRLSFMQELKPAPYSILCWVVPEIRGVIAEIGRARKSEARRRSDGRKVVFERYEWMEQDVHGVWTSPDGTQVAWFKDPDGNVLSLAQFVS